MGRGEQPAGSFWDEERWIGLHSGGSSKRTRRWSQTAFSPAAAEVTPVSPTPNISQEESDRLSRKAAAPAERPHPFLSLGLHVWVAFSPA